jgi:hypothetical protein
MRTISFLFLLLILPIQISAQVTQEWVRIYNSPGNLADLAGGVAVDDAGNIYVSGYSGLSNFNYNLIKYNPDGEIIWIRTYDYNSFNDMCYAIILDNEGNIYVTGESKSTSQNADIATIKYDSSGTQLWVQRYSGGSNFELANQLGVDDNNNIYVGGRSGDNNIIIKYNSSGAQQWTKPIDGDIRDMTVDQNGNVYLAGPKSENGFLIAKLWKYDTNGSLQWSKNPLGTLSTSMATGVEVDNEGNVFIVMSQAGNYVTVKYNSNGAEQWVQSYQSQIGSSFAYNIAVDENGNCFLAGIDYTNTSNNETNITTIKYSSDGNQLWVRTYNGPDNSWDDFKTIKTDNEGNVYVYGETFGDNTLSNLVLIKYSTDGNTLWVQTYSTPVNEYPITFTIDNNYNIYATGRTSTETTFADRILIKYSQDLPLKITKPLSGIKWMAGETDTIRWTGGKAGQFLEIQFSDDGGNSYIVIDELTPADSGFFVWNKPQSILSSKAKIKIKDLVNPIIVAESEKFRIKPYLLTRLNPDSTYYEYRKNRDQFNVVNDSTQMWPVDWYSQFNYQGIDSFTNSTYSQWQADSAFAWSNSFDHMDWVSWVNTFSINACYHSTFLGIYKADAVLKWDAKSRIWGGSCFGNATANALAFVDSQGFRTKYPEFPDYINPINVTTSNAVRKTFNELFTYQWGNPHLAQTLSNWLTRTPNETLNDIKQMLKEDNGESATLSFWNNNGSGGHNVLPYSLIQDTLQPHIYHLFVYDNSIPTSNNPITFNTLSNAGKGSWNTPDWFDPVSGLPWGGNFRIILKDKASNYLSPPSLPKVSEIFSPFVLDEEIVEIYNKRDVEIIIKNSQGETIGFQDGNVIQNLSGGVPLIRLDGSQTPPLGYSLPTNNYAVMLNDFAEDNVKAFFFTGNKSFIYERNGAIQTQTDRLFFDGGVSAVNPDAQTKTVKILNLINETTQEKLFVARSLGLAQNDSVKIENPDSNKVKLISYGTAKNYDLELNYVTENGLGRFVDSDVSLPANTSHTFVPVWTDLTNTELQVLVDIGNDGTIDDTLRLVNQVTGIGEDQGSLLTPNSYNLAQNYPNPFNPATKISWQSPVGSHQTLKIYDVLGNEVATLVNEFRNAGSYEIDFDASSLSSGIYFYRLQAGSFVETKKMILMK